MKSSVGPAWHGQSEVASHGRRSALCDLRPFDLRPLLVLALVAVAAGAVWAQDEVLGPDGEPLLQEEVVITGPDPSSQEGLAPGLYFHPLGLAYLAVAGAVWFLIWAWVHQDCGNVTLLPTLWGLLVWSTGLLHFLLILVLPNVYIGAGLGVLIFGCAVGAYAWARNARVSEDRRVMTSYHLRLVLRRILYQFGVVMAPPELMKVDEREGVPVILQQHDGVVRDGVLEGRTEAEPTRAVKSMLGEAVAFRASDVHLEPKADQMGVRYRIDGMLHSYTPFPSDIGSSVINTIKVLAGMDIATRRRPQDGSFSAQFPTLSKSVDFRVATSPSIHGETMVVRVLDRDRASLHIEQLGMTDRMVAQVTRLAEATRGMLLIVGPTGCGKTTTLYALMGTMDVFQRNVMTLENPVEYRLDNVTQIPVEEKGGLQFANSLRSVVRQDPDVIMVGEVRDRDTAEVALESVMTGHLVLSSVHAPDAVGTIFRLLDLGVDAATLGSGLTASLSQRLVRLLCKQCRVPYKPKGELLARLKLQTGTIGVFYRPAGCPACAGTGFYGRTGIFELLVLNDAIRELIRGRPSVSMLRDAAAKAGMIPLYQAGLQKVVAGVTSIKEMLRVIK